MVVPKVIRKGTRKVNPTAMFGVIRVVICG